MKFDEELETRLGFPVPEDQRRRVEILNADHYSLLLFKIDPERLATEQGLTEDLVPSTNMTEIQFALHNAVAGDRVKYWAGYVRKLRGLSPEEAARRIEWDELPLSVKRLQNEAVRENALMGNKLIKGGHNI